MSALRFNVHMDKENAAHVFNMNRGKALNNFGSGKRTTESNRGKLPQSAQRKALTNVINDPAVRNSREKQLTVSKDEFCSSLKFPCKVVCGVENVHGNQDSTQGDFYKRAPSLQQQKVLTDVGYTKHKTALPPQNQKTQLKPKSDAKIFEENYDTDAIFPKSERLSSYVNRLLTWRPPCLFGVLPDSESDSSDLEQLPEDDDILLDMQLPTPTVPEFSDEDLLNLMNDLPPQSPGCPDDGLDKDTELSLDQTIDSSLTFGSLHVMHGSLEIPDLDSSTDLDLSAS